MLITPRSQKTDVVTRPRTACYEERVDNGPPPPLLTKRHGLPRRATRAVYSDREAALKTITRAGRNPGRTRLQNPYCSSNRLVTEPSRNTSRTALAIVGAIDSTVSLSRSRLSSTGVGSVSVNTNDRKSLVKG